MKRGGKGRRRTENTAEARELKVALSGTRSENKEEYQQTAAAGRESSKR